MNSKLISLTIGAALSIGSAVAFADHGRHGDWHNKGRWDRGHDSWRDNGFRHSDREHRHFNHHRPHWKHHYRHHRHDRWCGHWAPRAYDGARWSSHGYDHGLSSGRITLIFSSDLD